MGELDLSFLPAVNAGLNALATLFLILGYVLIRQKRWQAHRNAMFAAFGSSIVFLTFYVLHKAWKSMGEGPMHTEFGGEGLLRVIYLLILLTHLVLAMLVPILAVAMIITGLRRRDALHRRLGNITLPIWLYVSVTGVVIYLMLYPFNPGTG
ncbi:MAG: DUF420 domain-containing protein [Phycisphaeraceae bacterium]